MPISTSERLRATLEREAHALGFDAVGVTRPDADPAMGERLRRALADGHHATMAWMAGTAARRSDPRVLWPEVRSLVMLGMNYGPESDPLAALDNRSNGTVSVYARHRDYHDVVKGRLKTLAAKLLAAARRLPETAEPADVKVFVDTAPLMEKPLAAAAGLGWQGKHTNLVSRGHGSWLFLGAVLTTLDLAPDTPERDHCGTCTACLDICPTDAFPAPYRLDARRCISYLTIEHAGPIPEPFRKPMGNRIYGCDDCLAVCPWNKFASAAREAKLAAPEGAAQPRLADLLVLDDRAFRARFAGSPVKRIGVTRFLRNCAIAAGNARDPALLDPLAPLCEHADAVLADAARWAVGELKDGS